ncbi:Glyoxalase/Bleomycin resistance protein/Dihydroxybiphenyl dioxygenase [Pelagophyceae sp. CCMP2097]|nr:Glyoxalase/Bleomycin resistance protein/Dihydroxybiphenyl dioxygenase [Pelagophyceae sp. CCMP2097]|mmetsp:Transcript_2887/g.8573  ORF Transcript_2887/g.8573 Transcript_2887/m.8573 type:complete len:360 (-) Transcript_2887:104-1183(-)
MRVRRMIMGAHAGLEGVVGNAGIERVIGDYAAFVGRLRGLLAKQQVDEKFEMDHICFRCATHLEYASVIHSLTPTYGRILVEGMIGGRPISTVLLNEPLRTESGSIECIEVPCPKAGSAYASGLEHAELVVGLPGVDANPMGDAAIRRFASEHPWLELDGRAAGKAVNCDFSLQLTEETAVKFHATTLAKVCQFEATHGVEPVPEAFVAVRALAELYHRRRDPENGAPGLDAAGLDGAALDGLLAQVACACVSPGTTMFDGGVGAPYVAALDSVGLRRLLDCPVAANGFRFALLPLSWTTTVPVDEDAEMHLAAISLALQASLEGDCGAPSDVRTLFLDKGLLRVVADRAFDANSMVWL